VSVQLEEHPAVETQPTQPPQPPPEPPRRGSVPLWIAASGLVVAMVLSGVIGGLVARDGNGGVSITSIGRPRGTTSASSAAGFENAYKTISPSVVQVVTSNGRTGTNGSGSGVIIDKDGLVVTNAHVVANNGDIEVVMDDGERRAATVLGRDTEGDLALLRLSDPPNDLAPATLGDSSAVSVGQPVAAVGNPFGLQSSLSVGVISGIGRTFSERPTGVPLRGLLQTDAPINPGNSGGPLIDSSGAVLGINTAIESPVQGSVGVGFAIPINQLKDELSDLAVGRTVRRAFLGIQGRNVRGGVEIVDVLRGSTAEAAGLRSGDIVVSLGGRQITRVDDLANELTSHKVGDRIGIEFRRDGQNTKVTVELKGSNE
jgi:S1-C subfamily serine protease